MNHIRNSIHIIIGIIFLFHSCYNQKKEEKYEKIDIENGITIRFNMIFYQHMPDHVQISIRDDYYKIIIAYGEPYYNDETKTYTLDIAAQNEFKLSEQQTDSIKSLISNIDNRIHCINSGFYCDTYIAAIDINKNRIFYSHDFGLPDGRDSPYSDNPYLDKLIIYLIELSQIDIRNVIWG